jgi:hypothetical protein
VLVIAVILVIAAGGFEQHLVDFYAVAVFASFLAATLGCARLSHRDGRRLALAFNVLGAIPLRLRPRRERDATPGP